MPAQACGIRVSAAGAIWGMGKIYGFVEYLFDLGTSHAQISEGISTRQQGVGVADGDVTGRNVSADTSGILDGYIRVLAQKEERLSDKVGNVPAILGSGSGTAWKFAATLPGNTLKAEVFGCHTHHFIAEGIELIGVPGQGLGSDQVFAYDTQLRVCVDGGHDLRQFFAFWCVLGFGGVFAGNLVAEQEVGNAGAGIDYALCAPAYVQFTYNLGILPRLGNTGGFAIGVFDLGRIRAGGAEAVGVKVAQQGVRVAADDHVHPGQFLGQCHVISILVVGQQDDLVDASGFQLINHRLGSFCFIQKDSGIQRTGAVLRFIGNVDADNAHLLPANLLDGVGLDVVVLRHRCQRGADSRFYVCRQNRGAAAACSEEVQELCQAVITSVEFVVAQGEGIEAHLIH